MSFRKTNEVRELSLADDSRWDEFVRSSWNGTIYNTTAYLRRFARAVGEKLRVFAVEDKGEIVAGLAVLEQLRRSGAVISNRPFLYFNGAVLGSWAVSDSKLAAESKQLQYLASIADRLSKESYARVLLHHRLPNLDVRSFVARGWTASLSYTYIVELAAEQRDGSGIPAGVDKNIRRLARRGQEAGLVFSENGSASELFSLHLATHKKKSTPLYLPERQFLRFVSEICDAGLGRIFVARDAGGRVVAAQFVLLGEFSLTHTVCAGTEDAWQRLGASAFLRLRTFQALASGGFQRNDLTDASIGPVLQFKRQLGGQLSVNTTVVSPSSLAYRLEQGLRSARKLPGFLRRMRPSRAEAREHSGAEE